MSKMFYVGDKVRIKNMPNIVPKYHGYKTIIINVPSSSEYVYDVDIILNGELFGIDFDFLELDCDNSKLIEELLE